MMFMSIRRFLPFTAAILLATTHAHAQFDQSVMKRILEEFSLQLFGENASGYMGPLVIVTNVGANHGFYTTAQTDREDRLTVGFSLQSVYTWVRDDQRTYTGSIPYRKRSTDSYELQLFKFFLEIAARNGDLDTLLRTATVFGGQGSWFRIPKEYLRLAGVPEDQIALVPDSLQLTNGTNQQTVFAAVPQISIGTWKHTDALIRYIPPIIFDKNIGKFSFFGIGIRHGFTHWFRDTPVDAAVQVTYQHSGIENRVGVTQAKLDATTDMYSINVHAGRRFEWFEPFAGLSVELLRSAGSYTFTLPANVKAQIGYDIDPQTAHVGLSDEAVKLTVGAAGHFGNFDAFLSAGISKHFILAGGVGVRAWPWKRR
ncbi:MAG: hypothetical protein QHI48_03375 [Bacteroidota bacterium]|nr:hypothetical protein [Bacteroidota bacterium]